MAQVLANSVLPTPGGPSIKTGFSSAAANRIDGGNTSRANVAGGFERALNSINVA